MENISQYQNQMVLKKDVRQMRNYESNPEDVPGEYKVLVKDGESFKQKFSRKFENVLSHRERPEQLKLVVKNINTEEVYSIIKIDPTRIQMISEDG